MFDCCWFIKNTLPEETKFDEESRKRLVEDTLAAVSPLPNGVTIVTQLPNALVLALRGPENAIKELRQRVINGNLGTIEPSTVAFRGD